MRIRIVAVGKPRGFAAAGVSEYLGRMRDAELLEVRQSSRPAEEAMQEEGKQLLELARGQFTIALTAEGKQYSSEELASLLASKDRVTFLVGSSHGLSSQVLASADMRLSLSRMTLPHELALLVLAEQVYRSATIQKGHPYHK
ncbi:23S rRNA (pseudouridine(1915)-N(3))-methyltransferase RlmH [Candidatus Woesearchaeota archaeon]|nr:23S rRNA (pseudouridine(1915)-N(3))-methyltransferase RlmH [Candidatus Woesearchaeota archaeon]